MEEGQPPGSYTSGRHCHLSWVFSGCSSWYWTWRLEMWHLEPARLQGQTTTKPVNAFPDAANQPFWAGECEASWMRACRFQGSNPTHVRNQLKTDVPFSKEEARTRAREEPGLETLAGDLPSAPRAWIWEPGIWWSHSLGRMPCFNWHPRLCRRKSTMAGPPGPVWKGWEHCSEEFPTLSTRHPTAFIQHEILVLSWAPDVTFKTHKRNTGFQQIKSCSAFDCNEVDIKGHPLHVCSHSGYLPGGGVLLRETSYWFECFFLELDLEHCWGWVLSTIVQWFVHVSLRLELGERGTLVARSLGVCTFGMKSLLGH